MMMALALMGCSERVSFPDPVRMDDTFARAEPDSDSLARFQAAADYSEAHSGRALLVLQGDEVVFETGQNGHGLEEPTHLFSGTKSFTCALFELARQHGITAEDAVTDALPELPVQAQGTTVDDLLHLTSGTRPYTLGQVLDGMRLEPRTADRFQAALEVGWVHEPGDVFDYGGVNFDLFGLLVERQTQRDPLDLLTEGVFDPIGMQFSGWTHDPVGNPALSYGAWTTANEWAKFGALVRDDGRFLGETVLPPGLHECFAGSDANPAYGRGFWLNQAVDDGVELVGNTLADEGRILLPDGPSDLVAAAGHKDQRLYIIPSLDLVVVRLSDGGRGYTDADFLSRLLP